MSQTFKLYRLQQIDSQLDKAHARLEEIQTTLDDDRSLRQAQNINDEEYRNLLKAQKEYRWAEDNLRSHNIKIKNNESALYSGKVTNPKELQDLQNESEALNRYLNVLEDNLLESMLFVENAEEKHESAQAKLNDLSERRNKNHKNLSIEKENIEAEVERLEKEGKAASKSIPAEDLKLYHNLRKIRLGVAVTVIENRNCSACGSTLSSSSLHSARFPSKITKCDSCGRILYHG